MTPKFSNHITSVVAKKLIVSIGSSRIYLTEDYHAGWHSDKEGAIRQGQDIVSRPQYKTVRIWLWNIMGTEFTPFAPRVN